MKKMNLFFVAVLLGLSFFGCKKSSSDSNNIPVDLASNASGTYNGWSLLVTNDSVTAKTVITKQSTSLVSVSTTINNVPISFTDVTVSDDGNGKIHLTQSAHDLSGTVNLKSLVYYINGVRFFSGSKP